MPRKTDRELPIPAAARPAHDAILALTDAFCQERLNAEYEALYWKLGGAGPETPLAAAQGQAGGLALRRRAGQRLGQLSRRQQQLATHEVTAIDKALGVAESTGQGKAKAIRDLLKIRQLDFHWMLRQRIEESPMAWMVQVNGFIVDARRLKREVQEEAFRKGLIPYIPGEKPTAEKSTDEEDGSHP